MADAWVEVQDGEDLLVLDVRTYLRLPHRAEEREHGHTFRISVISRGSYGVRETGEYADADYWGPQTHVLEVRAFSLQSAMRQAAQVRFTDWGVVDDDDEDELL